MRPRFQADANLRSAIVDGVRRREPSIDFRSARGIVPEKMDDPALLAFSAGDGRILVSHDVHTMPIHFADFQARGTRSPGILLLPQKLATAEVIEEIVLIWSASEAEEWSGRIVWLPL